MTTRLDTYDQVRAAAIRVQTCQSQLADGMPLDLDAQREILDIAYAALLIAAHARTSAEAPASAWREDGDGERGEVPAWLAKLWDDDVPLPRPPLPGLSRETE